MISYNVALSSRFLSNIGLVICSAIFLRSTAALLGYDGTFSIVCKKYLFNATFEFIE